MMKEGNGVSVSDFNVRRNPKAMFSPRIYFATHMYHLGRNTILSLIYHYWLAEMEKINIEIDFIINATFQVTVNERRAKILRVGNSVSESCLINLLISIHKPCVNCCMSESSLINLLISVHKPYANCYMFYWKKNQFLQQVSV